MMTLDEFILEWRDGREHLLVHTSGSTGEPKPLWVSKRRMEASARVTCAFLGLQKGDTALLCMPLDYIAGKMMVVRSLVWDLNLLTVEPSGHPLSVENLKAWPAEGIAFAAMVPMQVYNSLHVADECRRLRSIRQLIVGGGAIDAALETELRTFPGPVWSTYGMTETLSHIALRRLSGPDASAWYTPFDGVGLSLASDGCLRIDAPLVCEQPIVTHDRAELTEPDAQGRCRFRILGRKDNVICSGGLKIQAEEVERALQPFVSVPFLITRCKDEKFGETVVLLAEKADGWDKERLKSLCRDHLPRYWVPRHFVLVDHLPLTETGKLARQQAETLASQFL